MELRGEIRSLTSLHEELHEEMLSLLNACFENVQRARFLADLSTKSEVFLLRTRSGALAGFSTAKYFSYRGSDAEYRVVFSGDTVIAPPYWGSLELPLLWGARMLERWEEQPEQPLLWLLISKGIRTYKFLPTFFREFYPRCGVAVSAEIQALMHDLGRLNFGSMYDAERGLVCSEASSYFLRPELASIPPQRQALPNTEFFLAKNPAYDRGNELLCLAAFHPQNLRPFILRAIVQRRMTLNNASNNASVAMGCTAHE